MTTGRQIYRTNVVKPVISSNWDEGDEELAALLAADVTAALLWNEKLEIMGKNKGQLFKDSRKSELDGLWKNGTFKIVKRSTVPAGSRIYGCRFVDEIKTADGKTYNCLLYTSPSPRDQRGSRMPSSA